MPFTISFITLHVYSAASHLELRSQTNTHVAFSSSKCTWLVMSYMSLSGHAKDDLRRRQDGSDNRFGGQLSLEFRQTGGPAIMQNVLKVLTEVSAALANDSEMEVGQAAKDHT